MIGCLFSTGVSWATYLVVPDLVVSVTFGSFRTFFTHWDSPRVGTRYFTPSTSTGVTGTLCGCLLARLMTVSVSLWTAPVAGEGEDQQAGAVADADGGGAQVGAERQLTIRPRRHEVISRTAPEDAGVEAVRDVAALVFEGYWWHRYADIGGEQRDKCFDIAGFVRADEL